MTYRAVRSIAFRLDPERVHGIALRAEVHTVGDAA